MMYYMNLISIVIAVSLDGFGVGVSYGMRKIRMSFTPIMIIMICSGSIVVMSMTIGNFLRQFIPPEMTHIVGSILLIIIGGFVLISIIRMRLKDEEPPKQKNNSNRFTHFKSILSTPQTADRDKSGTISVGEALVLGIALALDAFGAGLGAAMLGYSPIVTPLAIAIMSGVFLYTGMKVGYILAKFRPLKKLTYLPPLLLISIGIYHLL